MCGLVSREERGEASRGWASDRPRWLRGEEAVGGESSTLVSQFRGFAGRSLAPILGPLSFFSLDVQVSFERALEL